jgi:hypothetical protein
MNTTQVDMPQRGSSVEICDYVLRHQIAQLEPRSIVDFGAGAGKNGRIAREILGNAVRLVAVEGFEPTARMLEAGGPYDEVRHILIEDWIARDPDGRYDLAIFGDVLEHLAPSEIRRVMKICLRRFATIIVVIPLHNIYQDEAYGNRLEIHRAYITSGFFDRYRPVEKHIVRGDGWTIMNVCVHADIGSPRLHRRAAECVFHVTMIVLQPLGLARPLVTFIKKHFLKYKWVLKD